MPMSRTRKIVLILSGIALVVFVVGVLLVALIVSAFSDDEPDIADKSVVVFNLGGSLPDYVADDPLAAKFLNRDDESLTNILLQLRKAKTDARIGGVMLKINLLSTGWAKVEELRDALADYRTSGKPVHAVIEFGTNKEYYLATACDKIFVLPEGVLFINGLAADVMFFRGSLDKLGVQMEVAKIGKYKNAPDQLTEKQMTEAHREVVNSLLDEQFNRYIDGIAQARNISAQDVRTLIDNAPLTPEQARDARLIDAVAYRDEVDEDFRKRLNYNDNEKDEKKLRTVAASKYKAVTPESLDLNKGERIAVIYAAGTVNSGTSGNSTIGADTIVKALNDARDDKTVRAVVLRIDSGGGSGIAGDAIDHAVNLCKARKPVVISMGDTAASAAYQMSMSATKIVAQPSTVTGSIGVFSFKPVVRGLYDWLGVSNEYVLRGKNAGLLREDQPFTPDERRVFENMVQNFYQTFITKVARGRSRDVEYINSIAQGRVWTGAQARERGLVDEIGGFEKSIQVAKSLANIPADKEVRRVVFPAPKTFLESFLGNDTTDEARATAARQTVIDLMPKEAQRSLRYVSVFDKLKRGEAVAMMPFDLEIK